MRVAILGAGAIGSLVGAFIQRSGTEVILVDPYEAHMKKIREEGLVIQTADGEWGRVKMQTCLNAAEAGSVDMVIVLVKAYLTEAALAGAGSLFGENTIVCTLQNGLGTEQKLLDLYPAEKVFYGCLQFNSRLTAPGEIFADIRERPGHKITIGPVRSGSPHAAAVKSLCQQLNDSGCSATYAENIDYFIWKKALNNIACNALCGILRLTGGQMYDDVNSRAVLEAIIREVIAVAQAKGVDLGSADEILAHYAEYPIKNIRLHYPSTAQDMLGKRKSEIDFLNAAIVRYGETLGVPTPVNATIAALVRAIENNYENQSL